MRFKEFLDNIEAEELILEGGAAGHMSHIQDDLTLTFKEFKEVINDSLKGNLQYVTTKWDGQNLFCTWKDGKLLFARNSQHIKGFGKNAMGSAELKDKFKDRGGLTQAFSFAADDLFAAISKLSDKDKANIFKNGKKFMNFEILYIGSENIIHYGENSLVLHGTKIYDIDGNVIGEGKGDAEKLASLIKKINQHKQNTFEIKGPKVIKLPEIPDFKAQSTRLIAKLEEIKGKYNLSDSNTIYDYKAAYFTKLLNNAGIKPTDELLNRWIASDKTYTLAQMKKLYSTEEFNKLKEMDKSISKHWKETNLPFEMLVIDLGTTVLMNVTDLATVNPSKAVENIRKRMEDAISEIRKKGTPDMLNKLNMELSRLQAAGGMDRIIPEEGIVFKFKDKVMKLTGSFAPINQITNMTWRLAP